MSDKNYDILIEKYPKLMKISYVECPEGWYDVIEEAVEKLSKFEEHVRVEQIKEKFGTLRFYTDGGNEHTNTVISFVEYISGFICETTGKTDDVGYNKKGWIKVHHNSLAKSKDFHYIDDEELREIINKQMEFKFDSDSKK